MQEQLVATVRSIREAHPEHGVKVILIECKRQMPDESFGAKEVRQAIAVLTAESAAAAPEGSNVQHASHLPRPIEADARGLSCSWTCMMCKTTLTAANRRACAGCKQVWYCGSECQRKDWKMRHKSQCRHLRQVNQEMKTCGPTAANANGWDDSCSVNRFLVRAERLLLKREYEAARELFKQSFLCGEAPPDYLESFVFEKPVHTAMGFGGRDGNTRGCIRCGDILDVETLKAILDESWECIGSRCIHIASPLLGISKSFQMQYTETKQEKDVAMALDYANAAFRVLPSFNHMLQVASLFSMLKDYKSAAAMASKCLEADIAADPTYIGTTIATQHLLCLYTMIADYARELGDHERAFQLLMVVVGLERTNAGSHFNAYKVLPIAMLAQHFGGEEELEAVLTEVIRECEAGIMLYGAHYLPHFQHGLQRVQQRCVGYLFGS